MKTKFLCLSLLFLFAFHAKSQSLFSSIISPGGPIGDKAITEAIGDNLFITATILAFPDRLLLIGTDSIGRQRWSKVHRTGGSLELKGSMVRGTKLFLVGSETGPGTIAEDALWVEIDSSGNLLQRRRLDDNTSNNYLNVISHFGTGFIMAGMVNNPGFHEDDFSMILSTSSGGAAGSTNWASSGGGFGELTTIAHCSNMDVIVGGQSEGLSFGGMDLNIHRLDPFSSPLWEVEFGSSADEFLSQAIEYPNGDIFVAGTRVSAGVSEGFLLKADSMGNLLWTKSYSDVNAFEDLLLMADGSLLLFGQSDSGISGGLGGMDVLAIKTDSAGTVDWTRAFGTDMNDVAMSIRTTLDGQYIVNTEYNGFLYLHNLAADGSVSCDFRAPSIISSPLSFMENPGSSPGMFGISNDSLGTSTDTVELAAGITKCCDLVTSGAFSTSTSADSNVFSATGTNALSYHWDFGDGNSSSGQNVTHHYGDTLIYTVCLSIRGYCDTFDTCMAVMGSTGMGSGLENLEKSHFNIFPNPIHGSLIKFSTNLKGAGSLLLLDIQGKMIFEHPIRDLSLGQVKLPKLENGIYLLELTDGDQKLRQSLVKTQ